jgi:hypothetical protein
LIGAGVKAEFPALPAGFIVVPLGGRPKKEARDAALFLAKYWRMECGDSPLKAEKWIVDEWEKAGTEASKGIGETAHVRSAIKRARSRGLNTSFLTFCSETKLCVGVELRKAGDVVTLGDGARAWHWCEGLTEAVLGIVRNPKVTFHQEVMRKSSLVIALQRAFCGPS